MSLHWGAEFTCYTPFLHDTLGLGMRASGLYMGTAVIGLATGGLLVGRLRDGGTRGSSLAALALLTSGLGHVAMTVPVPQASWPIRVVHEFGDGASMVVLLVLVHRQFPRERIGGLGAVTATATIVGRLLGSLVFAPMGRAFGYGWPLAVSGVLTALALVPLWPIVARVPVARVSSTP